MGIDMLIMLGLSLVLVIYHQHHCRTAWFSAESGNVMFYRNSAGTQL